ncbi:sodium:alanine symporter family protein [Porphyromonas pogonae]|uniref:alanine/glycine:cation symporter family protein n=1 Tax=Porphyromonas pogonae TaxID=867595 RepID=UPI002E783C96|nr:sodium:alanine symporter family protein [Porphyromonas pogonae]
MTQHELLSFVSSINQNFIGPVLSTLLLCTGIYYTIRLGFIQRYLKHAIVSLIRRNKKNEKASDSDGMTPFQALTTAIASQVGTGNIVGVSTALVAGGPGALFWMWVSAIIGMSTNFAEAVLGQLYKTQKEGHILGGPAYYMRNGMKSKLLAGIFSVFFIIALGMIAIMLQSNSITDAVYNVMPLPNLKIYVGIFLAIIVGSVLTGGISRIASIAERIVPFMASIFIIGCLIFIGAHIKLLPGVISDIFYYAFTPRASTGGVIGITLITTIRYGVNRGLTSNEAGLGSTPHAHAIAKVKNPYDQGLVALIGIAVDLLICTFTALVILLSGVLESHPEAAGVAVSQHAFNSYFGNMGNIFIAVALFLFAFSTIIGCYFFGVQNVRYLFGEKGVWPYNILVLGLILLASMTHVTLLWEISDTFNLFIVTPNVIALIFLSPQVVKEVKKLKYSLSKKGQTDTLDETPEEI